MLVTLYDITLLAMLWCDSLYRKVLTVEVTMHQSQGEIP
jgi:hypothetical protein